MMGGGLKFLAPAGRHVYSTQETLKVLKPQRGDMCIMFRRHRPNQNILSNLYRNVNACLSPQRGGMCIMFRLHRPNQKHIVESI